MSKEKTPIVQVFEDVEEVDDSLLHNVPEGKQKPAIHDPSWTDYILNLLTEKEVISIKDKKYPRMDGLRRVCNLVLGRVYESISNVIAAPDQSNNFTATVSHTLRIKQGDGNDDLVITGVADASREYLQHPFNQYVVSNAETKAIARAYRNALQLQVLVSEELNSVNDLAQPDEPEDAQPADDAQKSAIKAVSKKLGIDVNKLINLGPVKHSSLDKVLKGTARKIMSVLNGYQQGTTDIPDEIKL